MLNKMMAILLAVLCLSTRMLAQDRPVLQNGASQSAWRDDLHLMYEKMKTAQAVTQLEADIPYLTDEQIKVGLMQIVALVDGHTQIGIFQQALQFHLYGLRLYNFNDGIYIVDAQPSYQEAIGKKLVAVGSTDIENLTKQVSTVAQHDNDMMLKLTTAFYMVVPEVLHAMNIVEDVDQPKFVVEDKTGERFTFNPVPLTLDEYLKWSNGTFITLPPDPDVLYLQHQYDEAFWYTYLADSKTLYIQYNEVVRAATSGKTMQQFADELDAFVKTAPIDRTVVDLRHNTGGDNHFYPPLLDLLRNNMVINRPDKLYIIIGRMTLSAAVNFATELEQSVHPIFVGEPTGAPPNLYADARPLILQHSKMQVDISSQFIQKSTANDHRLAIEPTIPVQLSSTDYFNGRDPALEAILKIANP